MTDQQYHATIRAALNYYFKRYKDWAVMSAPDGDKDIDARLDAIEAALAYLDTLAAGQEWTPVGEYKSGHKYGGMSYKDDTLSLWDDECTVTTNLPDNIRLCQRATLRPRPATGEATP